METKKVLGSVRNVMEQNHDMLSKTPVDTRLDVQCFNAVGSYQTFLNGEMKQDEPNILSSAPTPSTVLTKDNLYYTELYCQICNIKFTDHHQYILHLCPTRGKSDTSNGATTCQTQNSSSVNKTSVKIYLCLTCDKVYQTKQGLDRHQASHIAGKHFVCQVCSKSYTSKSHFTLHQKLHTGQQIFQCDFCQRTFTFRSSYKWHMDSHKEVSDHVCDTCGKSFKHKQSYEKHKASHLYRKVTCRYCNKKFDPSHYRDHIVTHFKGAGSVTNSNSNLPDFLQLDVGQLSEGIDKPYKCDVCLKRFSSNSHFNQHKKLHMGVQPFRCNVCGRGFTFRSSYKWHMESHSDVQLYSCHVCQKSFKHKQSYTKHMLSHNNNNNRLGNK